jgi:hypothetical protein
MDCSACSTRPFQRPDGTIEVARARSELTARAAGVAALRRRVIWTRLAPSPSHRRRERVFALRTGRTPSARSPDCSPIASFETASGPSAVRYATIKQ